MNRLERVLRAELWLMIGTLVLFFVANGLSLYSESIVVGRTLVELAVICKLAALFFAGYIAAIFAAPKLIAHETHETLKVYALRFAVGALFVLGAF